MSCFQRATAFLNLAGHILNITMTLWGQPGKERPLSYKQKKNARNMKILHGVPRLLVGVRGW